YPSGSAFATTAAPRLVPAPGLFSTTACWPQMRESRSVVRRATVSVEPPGANGTTTRTGRVGQSSALALRATGGRKAETPAERDETAAVDHARSSPDAARRNG